MFKNRNKTVLIGLLSISISLNIYLIDTLSYKQDGIDRVLKYSHADIVPRVNRTLDELEEKLVDVDESKLKDRRYVRETLEDVHYELYHIQSVIDKFKLINPNYNFDIDALSRYVYELRQVYKTSDEGLTDRDKETLKEITRVRLYGELSGFYEASGFYYGIIPKKPKVVYKKQYEKLAAICDDAIEALEERY